MKELSIEEKAKRYELALERCRKLYNEAKANEYNSDIEDYETIFPELAAESEDERIRRQTLKVLNYYKDEEKSEGRMPTEIDECIDWLEKQGQHKRFRDSIQVGDKVTKNEYNELVNLSQLKRVAKQGQQKLSIEKLPEEMKSIGESLEFTTQEECDEYNQMVSDIIMSDNDKVELKFKVGDWVVRKDGEPFFNGNHYAQITVIDKEQYWFDSGTWLETKDIRLWTIRDAKGGDVLYSPCLRLLWIFKSRDTVYCGCNLNYNDGAFCGDGYFERPTDAIPATKEQRDLLFQKMKEAGYEWDDEKKELKKIEQEELSDFEKSLKHIIEEAIDDGDTHNLKADAELLLGLMQKPSDEEMKELLRTEYEKGRADAIAEMQVVWSDEDEENLQHCCLAIRHSTYHVKRDKQDMETWLKSLKQRIGG